MSARVVKLAAGEQPEKGWQVVPVNDGLATGRYAAQPDLGCTDCHGAGQMRVVMLGQSAAVEVVCDCVRRRVYRWLQQQAPPARLIGKAHPTPPPAPAGDDSYRTREIARLEAAVAESEPLIAAVEAQLRADEARVAALEEPAFACQEAAGAVSQDAKDIEAQIARLQTDVEVRVTHILETARAQATIERAVTADVIVEVELERDAWLDLASELVATATHHAGVVEPEVVAVRRKIDEHRAQLHRLRLGRYAEAQRRLPELRARRA
jgi:hypothetical protein